MGCSKLLFTSVILPLEPKAKPLELMPSPSKDDKEPKTAIAVKERPNMPPKKLTPKGLFQVSRIEIGTIKRR